MPLRMKRLLSLLALTMVMAGCDSGSNLAATPAVRDLIKANATLGTVTQGSTTVTLLTVPQSALPAELTSASSVQAVFGSTSVLGSAQTVGGTAYLAFPVPATSPLTLDASGKTKILFTGGSTVRTAELTVTRI